MTWKKVLLIVVVAIVIIVGITGALYQRKLTVAALTNAALIERAQALSRKNEADAKQYADDIALKNAELLLADKAVNDAKASEALIKTKSAAEIRDIRNQAGTIETKYNTLEGAAVILTEKVTALQEVVKPLESANFSLRGANARMSLRIVELETDLNTCKGLLDISIKNTASVLKKSWILKIFDRVKVGPGGGFCSDSKGHIGIFAIWAIN